MVLPCEGATSDRSSLNDIVSNVHLTRVLPVDGRITYPKGNLDSMLDGRVSSGNTVIEPAFLRANGEGAIVDGMHAADHREALKQHSEV
jgi:hypothetical protein